MDISSLIQEEEDSQAELGKEDAGAASEDDELQPQPSPSPAPDKAPGGASAAEDRQEEQGEKPGSPVSGKGGVLLALDEGILRSSPVGWEGSGQEVHRSPAPRTFPSVGSLCVSE